MVRIHALIGGGGGLARQDPRKEGGERNGREKWLAPTASGRGGRRGHAGGERRACCDAGWRIGQAK